MAKSKNKSEKAVTLDPMIVEIQEKMKDPNYYGAIFKNDEVVFTREEANAIRNMSLLSYSALLDEMRIAEQTVRGIQKVLQEFSPNYRTFLQAIIKKVENGETEIDPALLQQLKQNQENGDSEDQGEV